MSFQPPRPASDSPDYDLDEIREIAAQGRRLAIYDRATGLYAYWYLQLRATEELSRGQRHGKTVVCLSLWAASQPAIDALCKGLQAGLRDHDLAAYLNNGHFVVLLTETDEHGARIVVTRMLEQIPASITRGIACHPRDGATFEELLEFAKANASTEPDAA